MAGGIEEAEVTAEDIVGFLVRRNVQDGLRVRRRADIEPGP
jgi:hypothetical protein